jgi:hypothetical protein
MTHDLVGRPAMADPEKVAQTALLNRQPGSQIYKIWRC